MPTIKRIDIKSVLTAAAASTMGPAIMEQARQRVSARIGNGEHIHLYADDIEECLYPDNQCWKGPRNVRGS